MPSPFIVAQAGLLAFATPADTPAEVASLTAPAADIAKPAGRIEIVAPLLVNERLLGEINLTIDDRAGAEIDSARFMALVDHLLDAPLRNALVTAIAGRPRVPVGDLAIAPLTVSFDAAALELHVSVPVSRTLPATMSLRGYDDPDPTDYAPPAMVAAGMAMAANQRLEWVGGEARRAALRLVADGFITVGGFPGITLRGGGTLIEGLNGTSTQFERAPIRLSADRFASAIHAVAGEFVPAVTGFQGATAVVGIGIARDYAGIRPFENIRPSGRGAITLDRASNVVVVVNGVETRRLQLQPGRYQLTDLSSTSGANAVRLLIEDDLGRREIAASSFFAAGAMLDSGLTDFGMSLGKIQSAAREYAGPLAATGYVRRGFGGWLTLGLGGQAAGGNWQGNGEAVVGTPIGLFRLQAAQSRFEGRSGHALSLDWIGTISTGQSGTWNLTMLSSMTSQDFSSPFDRLARINDQRWHIDVRADWHSGPWGASLTASFADSRSHTQSEAVGITGYYGRGALSFTATAGLERTLPGSWTPRALIGVAIRLGPRTTGSLRADTRRGAIVGEYSRYPVDQVGDFSGRVQLSRNDAQYGLSGDARYLSNRFVASATQDYYSAPGGADPGLKQTELRFATFVGMADGALGIGRPGTGNFAIYDRHASLQHTKVVIRDEGGLIIGRHDALGNAVVPLARSYSPVHHTFDVDPLPPGYDLGDGGLAAFPAAASGYRVAVGSDLSRVAIGYLTGPGGPLIEMSGAVERLGDKGFGRRDFFTNANGRFAVDQLGPGQYRMMIGAQQVATFTIPESSKGMVDVGTLATTAP